MISKETKNPVEFITEENYMFNIGKFQQPVRDWLNSGALRPNNFLPSALTSLRSNEKLSVSRDTKKVSWGIPVPGDRSQTVSSYYNLPLLTVHIFRYMFGWMH